MYACPLAAVSLQWVVQAASGGLLARSATLYTSSMLTSGDFALQPLTGYLSRCGTPLQHSWHDDGHALQEPDMHITCVLCANTKHAPLARCNRKIDHQLLYPRFLLLLWSHTPAVTCFVHVSVVPAQISLVKSCLAVGHGLDMEQYLQSLWGQWDTVAEWLPQLKTCNKTELVKVLLAPMMQLRLE